MSILGIALVLLQVQLAGIAGMVAKPGGNEPLSRATVTLIAVAPDQTARTHSAVTEEDGRFTIRDIEPGDYRLLADSVRYGHTAYGQRKPDGPGSILSITAGQQLTDLRLSMIPTGTIAGRVTGLNGEPLVYATVQAFRYVYEGGRRVLKVAQSTTTNDRGEYRLFWLPARQYIVAAAKGHVSVGPNAASPIRPGSSSASASYLVVTAETQLAAQIQLVETSGPATLRILDDGTTREEAWPPVYYPGTVEARSATALDVAAGTTLNGVDIAIGSARVLSVRGRVVGFTPGSIATVNLIPQDTASAVQIPLAGKGASTRDGSFEFSGVLPGDYVAVARDPRTGLVGSPLSVHVGDRDVENVVLGMAPAVRVSGRILIEGAAADAGGVNPLTRVSVALIPNNNLPTMTPIPQIVAGSDLLVLGTPIDVRTGSFTVNNLAPGDYQIQVSGARLYLKSARLGLTDILGGVHIAGNTNDRLEIVLTADPGSVEGAAIGTRGGPAANATVVLVPNVGRKHFDLYRSVVTGTDGRFRFQDLAPGDYKLFAWDDVETGAWQDPDFTRLYESRGLLVHVAEKSKENVQLNVIYNP